MRRKCFILVGHSHWGKSETLWALTEGDLRRHMPIPAISRHLVAYVRRISNDDNEDALIRFSGDLALRIRRDYLVLTFCPKLSALRNCRTILRNLQSEYDLFFFVLREDYSQRRHITEQEIDFLRDYATDLSILNGHHEREVRARRFVAYIKRCLRIH